MLADKIHTPPGESDPAAPGRTDPLAAYFRKFLRFAGWRAWASLGLMLLLGFNQGVGLLMLIPLLRVIGIGEHGAAGKDAESAIAMLFDGAGIPLNLYTVVAVYMLIVTVQAAATRFQQIFNAELTHGFTRFLRNELNAALAHMCWLAFIRMKAADITHVLTSEIPRVANVTHQLMRLPGSLLVAGVYVSVAFSLSPPMTGAALLCGGGLVLLMRPFNRKARHSGQALRNATGAMYASVMEFLAGMKLAKSYGVEKTHLAAFEGHSGEIADQLVRFTRATTQSSMYFQIGTAIAVGGFLLGAVEILRLPADRLLVLVFIFVRLLPQFSQIQQSYQHIIHALPAFKAVARMEAMLTQNQEQQIPPPTARVALKHAIQLDRVSFRYDRTLHHFAVQGIDLTIRARQMTAIIGPSGAGKSTLADLLMGLLAPEQGCILIDGRPLAGRQMQAWRRSVGYVPQENFLFHDTIRANLRWAKANATDNEIQRALQAAAALDFVESLPEGLDTMVGDRGVRLSGGERQRIALARALLRRPTMLLLDEATSSLDSENERHILQAVEHLRGTITVVIIAHRLSTVRRAQTVVLLKEGKTVESGTWDELMQSPDSLINAMT